MASDEGKYSEKLSEVGTPEDAAQQALRDKYDQAEKAKAGEESGKSGLDDAKAGEESGKSGLDDAKAMIQEDFEQSTKGRGHEPPKEQLTSKLNAKADGPEHDTAATNLVKSAQDKLEGDHQNAAHEALGTLQQAKREARPTA